MKILLLADGVSWHSARLVNELRNQGCEVLFASAEESSLVDCVLPRSRWGAALTYWLAGQKVAEIIASFSPAVVSAHFASAYGVTAARARRLSAAKPLWSLHLWGSDIFVSPRKSIVHRARVRHALSAANILFADSTQLANEAALCARGKSLVDPPIVVPWGVEEKYFLSESLIREKANWRADRALRVILPRPHQKIYRNENILLSLRHLLADKKMRISVPTTGSEYQSFLAVANGCGLRGALAPYEPMPRKEFMAFLGSHDLCISAAESDSSPVTISECQAVGVACLVAKYPHGAEQFPEQSRSVALFNMNNPADLPSKISSLCQLTAEERANHLARGAALARERGVYENNIAVTIESWKRGCQALALGGQS